MSPSQARVRKGGWVLMVASPGRDGLGWESSFSGIHQVPALLRSPRFCRWCASTRAARQGSAVAAHSRGWGLQNVRSPWTLWAQAACPYSFPRRYLAFHPFPVLFMFRHTCSFYISNKITAGAAILELQTLQGNNGFQTATLFSH